jgi:hypothetical protein
VFGCEGEAEADRERERSIAARLPPLYGAGDGGPNHRVGFGAPDQGALVTYEKVTIVGSWASLTYILTGLLFAFSVLFFIPVKTNRSTNSLSLDR